MVSTGRAARGLAAGSLAGATQPSTVAARVAGATAPAYASSLDDDRHLNILDKIWRTMAAAYEIVRPFAYTVSVVPAVAGGALAAVDGRFS